MITLPRPQLSYNLPSCADAPLHTGHYAAPTGHKPPPNSSAPGKYGARGCVGTGMGTVEGPGTDHRARETSQPRQKPQQPRQGQTDESPRRSPAACGLAIYDLPRCCWPGYGRVACAGAWWPHMGNDEHTGHSRARGRMGEAQHTVSNCHVRRRSWPDKSEARAPGRRSARRGRQGIERWGRPTRGRRRGRDDGGAE